jgi:hypothetical protein
MLKLGIARSLHADARPLPQDIPGNNLQRGYLK